MPILILFLFVVASYAMHFPIYFSLKARRKILTQEREEFRQARMELAAAQGQVGSRRCGICKRVVYKYTLISSGHIICHDCGLETLRTHGTP